uniref:Photosystem I reaction center subunit VIII n=1 Tax=Dasya binghamiae TaxID=1896963 RepID=A0A1C8XSG7_9FLOR|nr:photosystem I subunit VIII [Dasya binghamiae]AOH77393.1 photosystem I subunit VIII [Dasya binghamiae]
MTASYLPSILVPLTGIIFPGLSMALLFLYIEEDNIT